MTGFDGHRVALQVLGVRLDLAAIHRPGAGVPRLRRTGLR